LVHLKTLKRVLYVKEFRFCYNLQIVKDWSLKNRLIQKFSSALNFNNDFACFLSDKGYLLISGHLKSGLRKYLTSEAYVRDLVRSNEFSSIAEDGHGKRR